MPTLKAFSCWIKGNEDEPAIRTAATASKAVRVSRFAEQAFGVAVADAIELQFKARQQ